MATITVILRATVEIDADDLLEYKTEKEEKISLLEDMGFTVKVDREDGLNELGAPNHDDDKDDNEELDGYGEDD